MYLTLHRVHLTNKSLAIGLNSKINVHEEIYTVATYIQLQVTAACFQFPI